MDISENKTVELTLHLSADLDDSIINFHKLASRMEDLQREGLRLLRFEIDRDQDSITYTLEDCSDVVSADDSNIGLWEKFGLQIDKLGLSSRTRNALRNAGIETVGELVQYQEEGISRIKGFNRNSRGINELRKAVSEMGLSFGMTISQKSE